MKTSNYQTNTGHRFISKGKTAFKIHIHTPDDKTLHRSVGFVRIGENKGLRKAIKLRNELGREMWGKHWNRILNQPDLITRLPHTLEPTYLTVTDGGKTLDVCQAMWSDRKGERHCRRYSLNKHGKLGAYIKAKKAILKAHRDVIDILLFMNRINTIDLK